MAVKVVAVAVVVVVVVFGLGFGCFCCVAQLVASRRRPTEFRVPGFAPAPERTHARTDLGASENGQEAARKNFYFLLKKNVRKTTEASKSHLDRNEPFFVDFHPKKR